tara:strand:- start:905 stop:1570 length:666 start_codon:yes stop_codon:yes gene_type:complete
MILRWIGWAARQPVRLGFMGARYFAGMPERKIKVVFCTVGDPSKYTDEAPILDYQPPPWGAELIQRANNVLAQANVRLVADKYASYATTTTRVWETMVEDYNSIWRFIRRCHKWYQRMATDGRINSGGRIVIFLTWLEGKRGYAVSRGSYVLIDPEKVKPLPFDQRNARGDVLAHEIGHLCDLPHTRDVMRLMHSGYRDTNYLTRREALAINTASITSKDA